MATLFAFRAIRPNPVYADHLVFTRPQAESVAGDNLPPLKMSLETVARQRPENPLWQEKAFRDIQNSLATLLHGGRLLQEHIPGIYIYEYSYNGSVQTGVWAMTSLDDYRDGKIKTHELTLADSLRRMKNYRRSTGLEGSPVLLTYKGNPVIDGLIAEIKKGKRETALGNEHGLHSLWKVEDLNIQQRLKDAFEQVGTVYLADGHHRLESALLLAEEQRAERKEVFNTISSLYLSAAQLCIREYDRVVIPEVKISCEVLFSQIRENFEVVPVLGDSPVQPQVNHRFGMLMAGQWYSLTAKPHTYSEESLPASLDPAILQDRVLSPVFVISDPRADPRLKCAGGEKAMEEIEALVFQNPGAVVFTLCPMTAGQLIAVADAGAILPPKSSWIDPKVPYGLLLYRHG